MLERIKKTAIEIAGIILAIAAIWYAFRILTFSSLSETGAKEWVHISELVLLGSAILLTIGLFGEWSDSEEWKKRSLYKAAKAAVIIGMLGELLGDGGIFQAGDRVTELQDRTIVQLLSHRSLSPEQKDRLVVVAKSFPAVSFVTATVQDDKSWGLALHIGAILQANGWDWVPCIAPGAYLKPLPPDPSPASCTTIASRIQINAQPSFERAANALRDAIKDPDVIGMDRVEVVINPAISGMAIIVGSKR